MKSKRKENEMAKVSINNPNNSSAMPCIYYFHKNKISTKIILLKTEK